MTLLLGSCFSCCDTFSSKEEIGSLVNQTRKSITLLLHPLQLAEINQESLCDSFLSLHSDHLRRLHVHPFGSGVAARHFILLLWNFLDAVFQFALGFHEIDSHLSILN
jgi:hypothetical protein